MYLPLENNERRMKQTLIDTVLATEVITDAYGADNYTSQQLQQLGKVQEHQMNYQII